MVAPEPTIQLMMSGRERLALWLDRSKLNQREAAVLLGMHFTHLNQILSGRRTPGLANAVTIERATGIPAEAWLASEVGDGADAVSEEVGNSVEGKA
jgi:transcriptional regulator with XRE-family HTH domain